jgi:hypothetical protein
MVERRGGCHQHLEENRYAFHRGLQTLPHARSIELFGNSFHLVDTARYLEGDSLYKVDVIDKRRPGQPCTIWMSAAHIHSRCSCWCFNPSVFALLQVHIGNRQIHEGLEVPFFTDHFRALTESLNSNLAGLITRQIITLTEV